MTTDGHFQLRHHCSRANHRLHADPAPQRANLMQNHGDPPCSGKSGALPHTVSLQTGEVDTQLPFDCADAFLVKVGHQLASPQLYTTSLPPLGPVRSVPCGLTPRERLGIVECYFLLPQVRVEAQFPTDSTLLDLLSIAGWGKLEFCLLLLCRGLL